MFWLGPFRLPVLILVLLSGGLLKAQTRTVDQQLIWLGARFNFDFDERWRSSVQFEERRYVFPDAPHQRLLGDLSLYFEPDNRWTIRTGLWLFQLARPQDPFEDFNGWIKEFRPYLRLEYRFGQRQNHFWYFAYKSEYRSFRTLEAPSPFEGPLRRVDWRQRFKVAYNLDLNQKARIIMAEELHLNTWSSAERHQWFQQNRITTHYQYLFSQKFRVSAGYVLWFQPTGQSAEYFLRHILDLRLDYYISR